MAPEASSLCVEPAANNHQSTSEQSSRVANTERPSRRSACNECKQQKLRCDLAAGDDEVPQVCSRCLKLGLECKVESAFKRARKRRRSFELENEIKELRRQLDIYNDRDAPVRRSSAFAVAHNLRAPQNPAPVPPAPITENLALGNANLRIGRQDSISSVVVFGSPSDGVETSRMPGLTTKPIIDQSPTARRTTGSIPRARSLENITLSVDEVEEIFSLYYLHYHPYLPFLNPSVSPHECYELSELLFWSIISVASRRLQNQPILLNSLARSVTELLWKTVRSIPYSLQVVQSLILLCTWPFPTSSSTADPSYVLVGVMVQTGTQMGLHRALNAQDFNKVPIRLDALEYKEWVKTWQGCSIVAQSVSMGCGLPTAMQMQDWSNTAVPAFATSPDDMALGTHLRIEQFRHRASQALASIASDYSSSATYRERIALYRLLNASLVDLEREILNINPITQFYVSAARLHLHAFYLFDSSAVDGYTDRIVSLYQTAASLIEQALGMDSQDGGFLHYSPFFCYQAFSSAAFVVLKLSMNVYFQSLIDVKEGKKLINAAISALRKMSVANNDLPGRLSDVIGFFCSLPNSQLIGGDTIDKLQLRVRNRLSMSIVYDSLWEWRNQFRNDEQVDDNEQSNQDKHLINGPHNWLC